MPFMIANAISEGPRAEHVSLQTQNTYFGGPLHKTAKTS